MWTFPKFFSILVILLCNNLKQCWLVHILKLLNILKEMIILIILNIPLYACPFSFLWSTFLIVMEPGRKNNLTVDCAGRASFSLGPVIVFFANLNFEWFSYWLFEMHALILTCPKHGTRRLIRLSSFKFHLFAGKRQQSKGKHF